MNGVSGGTATTTGTFGGPFLAVSSTNIYHNGTVMATNGVIAGGTSASAVGFAAEFFLEHIVGNTGGFAIENSNGTVYGYSQINISSNEYDLYSNAATRIGSSAGLKVNNSQVSINGGNLNTFDAPGGVAIGSYASVNTAPTNGIIVSGSVSIGASSPTAKFDVTGGSIAISSTGSGLIIRGGSNSRIGTGTLAGGTVTISNNTIDGNTFIFLQDTSSTVTNVGTLTVSATNSSGFTVTSTIAIDTSTFNWWMVESK
jgi:hypothetical protein